MAEREIEREREKKKSLGVNQTNEKKNFVEETQICII